MDTKAMRMIELSGAGRTAARFFTCLALFLLTLAAGTAAPASGGGPGLRGAVCLSPVSPISTAPSFEFQNGLWRNLHHTLYAFAAADGENGGGPRIRLSDEDEAAISALPASSRARWNAAVGWYRANLAHRDLREDAGLREVGISLSSLGDDAGPATARIPAELRAVLGGVEAIYRESLWPLHRRANDQWRIQAETLLASHGANVASRVACAFGVEWPRNRIPVALTAYAKANGAYTSLGPTYVTMATLDRRYQGRAALEMLMHETAHAMIFPLQERLAAAIAEAMARSPADPQPLRSGLWHEALFFITGRIVADEFPGYVPYAEVNGLWGRVWPVEVRDAFDRHVGPYLQGRISAEQAVARLVQDLATRPIATAPASSDGS